MAAHWKTKRRAPEVPVSSFSDIAFLLIIYFILATTLARMTGVVAEIPSGRKAQTKKETPRSVQLFADTIRFNDERVDIPELRRRLAALNLHDKSGEEKVVLLEAAGDVKYATYFDVMATISAAGGVTAILRENEGGG